MCATLCLDPFLHLPLRGQLIELPCGCQDVPYACGCICREHAHVHCDGQPVAQLEESR